MISVIILLIVFLLIAIRHIGKIRLQIWQVMLFGAAAVLATGQISPSNALKAINFDVILFLFCMFIIGQALDNSGYLSHLSNQLFGRAKSLDGLILITLFGMGILAAFLMNDTLAIIGTPVVLLAAKRNTLNPKVLLLTLAFAVTIGSAMSPIGNPQNLLVALNGDIDNPFISFFEYLLLPTLINLLIAYLLIRLFYRSHFNGEPIALSEEFIRDKKLAFLSRVSLCLLIVLIILKIALVLTGTGEHFRLTYIALVSACPVVLFSPQRFKVIRQIDWHTLLFFAAMFILMESVWDSGFFQSILERLDLNLASVGMIFIIAVVLSQFISNVPLVALYLPTLTQLGASSKEMLALAAGSTIAGNLTILGAASNVIIIQNAEAKTGDTLTFWEFFRIGVPLTILNVLVYWLFFHFLF